MKVKVVNRLTNYETVVENVTFVQIRRAELIRPSKDFNFIRGVGTVTQIYRQEEIVGAYPIDEYYVDVMEDTA